MSLEYLLALTTAMWLGLLTSISPCPLATNIAAISFVGRRVGKPGHVLAAGALYTVGRVLAYAVIGILLVESLLRAPGLSQLLQKYMNLVMGPLLIIVGMILLELISFNIGSSGMSASIRRRVESSGIWGAGALGILFALSFCPTSAALFFGSLIPLALDQRSGVLLPGLFGIGTGLPVMIFALLLALSANRVGKFFDRVTHFEHWARWITGSLFILIGIYFCLTFIFEIDLYGLLL